MSPPPFLREGISITPEGKNRGAVQLNFELQHFPVRQLAGPDRSGSFPEGEDGRITFVISTTDVFIKGTMIKRDSILLNFDRSYLFAVQALFSQLFGSILATCKIIRR